MPHCIKVNPHIFHFLLDSRIGGPQVYVDGLFSGLQDGYEISIFACGKSNKYKNQLFNFRIINRYLYPFEIIANIAIIFIKIITFNNSKNLLFHVHGSANIAPLIIARICNIPVLWHLHETTESYSIFIRIGSLFLLNNKSIIAVVSKKIIEFYGLNNKTIYLPAGIDSNFWIAPPVLKSKTNSLPLPLHIQLTCNVSPIKGLHFFIESLKNLNTKQEIIVDIIGAKLVTHADYYNFLLELASTLPSNIYLSFSGWKNRDSVRDQLSKADIFVLPSISEACPLSLLEAVSMNVYAIATDVGDVKEILENYKFGHVIKESSALNLSMGLNYVIDNELYKTRNNRKIHVDIWDIHNIIEKTKDIYSRMR